jgi:hypothetical protein
MERASEPISLQEAIAYCENPDNCREYVVARRWPNGVELPHLRIQGRNPSGESEPLAVPEQAFQAAVLYEDWHDLRRLPAGSRQVAGSDMAGF